MKPLCYNDYAIRKKRSSVNYILTIVIIVGVFFVPTTSISQVYKASSEDQTGDLKLLLEAQGFQSINAVYDYDKLLISYENRRYRREAQAIKEIVQLVTPKIPKGVDRLIILTKRLNIPILQTTVLLHQNNNDSLQIKTVNWPVQLQVESLSSQFAHDIRVNAGNYKLELEIKPELRLALGGFPDPVVHQLNLLPTFHFYLWKGARLSFQTTLPIWNEFENPRETFWRPRIFQFEQRVRLPYQIFASFSAGYFTKNRYGSVLEMGKYVLNGRLLLRGKIGYTGYATYEKEPTRTWKIGRLDDLDYKVGIDYYFKKWQFIASVEYAETLFNQNMLRASVSKYFREIEIGFFAFNTQKGNNYGLHVSIPLYPKKYFKPRFFSIRPAPSFDYIYHGTQNYVTQYQTIQDLRTYMKRLEPFFIQQQFLLKN